jgi:hypothetical protein
VGKRIAARAMMHLLWVMMGLLAPLPPGAF